MHNYYSLGFSTNYKQLNYITSIKIAVIPHNHVFEVFSFFSIIYIKY